MAVVPDLGGGAPAKLDPRKGGKYDLPILPWKGAQQQITSTATSQLSAKFASTCRAIRVAPIQDIRYEVGKIGVTPVADLLTSPFLGGGAVEDVRVKPGERIAILQNSAGGIVTITEDG